MASDEAAQSTESIIALLLQAADRLSDDGKKEAACCAIDFLFLLFSDSGDGPFGDRETEPSDFGRPDPHRFVRDPRPAVLT